MLGLAPATAMLAGVDPLATVLVAASVLLSRGLGSALAGSALNFALTERRAVSVGGGERALTVMTALVDAGVDIRVCGIFDDRDDSRSPPVVRGVPKLGTLVDLVAFVRAPEIDMLIVTLPLRADRRIREVLKAVEVLPVDVRLSGFSDDPAFRRRGASPARGGLIGVMSRPLRQRQRLVKRGLDLAGTAAAVLLLSPVLLQPPARRRSRANSIYAVRLPSRDDLGAAYFFSSQPYHPFSLGDSASPRCRCNS